MKILEKDIKMAKGEIVDPEDKDAASIYFLFKILTINIF